MLIRSPNFVSFIESRGGNRGPIRRYINAHDLMAMALEGLNNLTRFVRP